MRSLAFLDIACCALLVTIILFKLNSTGFTKPLLEGKSSSGTVTITNQFACPGKIVARLQEKGTSDGTVKAIDLTEDENKKGNYWSGQLSGFQVRMRVLGENETHRQISLQTSGVLSPNKRYVIEVTQESETLDQVQLKNDLEKLGIDGVETWFGEDAKGMRGSNMVGVRISLKHADSATSNEDKNRARVWLFDNLRACLRDSETSKGTVGGANDIEGIAINDIYERTTGYWEQRIRDAHKGASTVPGNPGSSILQEIALNACLVRFFSGEKFRIEDLRKLYENVEFGENASETLPNGFVGPEQLFAQLYHYLESESVYHLGNRLLLQKLLVKPASGEMPDGWETAWATGWDPNPADADDTRLTYPLKTGELEPKLKEQKDKNLLFSTNVQEKTSLAHGRLFYRMCINKITKQRIRAVIFYGSDLYEIDGELIPNADRTVTFRVEIDPSRLKKR